MTMLCDPLSEHAALSRINTQVARMGSEPSSEYAGRGIVTCGGGKKYIPCAWVCINMLRDVGCQLPIQLWYLGANELPNAMRHLFESLGVECVDACFVREMHPTRILNGWELKPYSIIHSRFREVIFIDADNVPVVDPCFLFDTPQYLEHGAIFWPDFGRLESSRPIWQLMGIPYRDEPEVESGQIVIDKMRCWKSLSLTMWMNEHSDFWYKYIHGDKETFHLAWRKIGQDYAMPARGIRPLPGCMCQHDFQGRRIFQHRNCAKWTIEQNSKIPGFSQEDRCLEFIQQLKPHWHKIWSRPEFDVRLAKHLIAREVKYTRIGYDSRLLFLNGGGYIGKGANRMERYWGLVQHQEQVTLEIYGDDGLTARLDQDLSNPNLWRGRWLIHERMPLEIEIMT